MRGRSPLGSAGPVGRTSDVATLLGMVERRGLTAEQFRSACSLLFAGQGSGQSLSASIAAVDEGTTSMAALIAAVTAPEKYGWTADRVIIWVEDDEAHAAVNLREGRSMRVALTRHGLTAQRYDGDHDAPVAADRLRGWATRSTRTLSAAGAPP